MKNETKDLIQIAFCVAFIIMWILVISGMVIFGIWVIKVLGILCAIAWIGLVWSIRRRARGGKTNETPSQ